MTEANANATRSDGAALALALSMAVGLVCCSSDEVPGDAERKPLDSSLRLGRTLFAEDERWWGVSSISVDRDAAGWPAPVCVAGHSAVLWLETDGSVVEPVLLESFRTRVELIDIQGTGLPSFMDTGGGWRPVALLNAEGRILWEKDSLPSGSSGSAPNQMAAGDLDGDGDLEFAIGTNGGGGLFVVDHEGELLHHSEGTNIVRTAILDVDEDGELEILHSGRPGVDIRDASAELVDRLDVEWGGSFSVVPGPDGSPHLAVRADHELLLMTPGGQEVVRLPVGVTSGLGLEVAWVRLKPNQEPYVAVSFMTPGGASLRVYRRDGEVMYRGKLPGRELPLATLPDRDGNGESLLVGSRNRVWRYRTRL